MLSIKRKSVGDWIADIIIYVLLTTIAIVMVIPFIYVIAASFATEPEIITRPLFLIPNEFTMEAYKRIFDMNDYGTKVWGGLGMSVYRTLVGTAINLFFTTTMAYGLSRRGLIGRNAIMNCILFTMVFSGGMIPTYLVVTGLGLYDSMWALMLPGAISAYNMIITKNFFQELPEGLDEAASIDGCTDIGIFFKIALPLSMPILATFGLFYAVGHWNDYFGPLLYLETASKFPFQLILRNIVMLSNDVQNDPNALQPQETLKMAVIVVGTVPILIVYPFLQKHFAAGVMVGAIKG